LAGGRLALLLVAVILAAGYAPLGYYASVSRHRADSALSVSLYGASEASDTLDALPGWLLHLRRSLERYNCSLAAFREAEPDMAAVYLEELERAAGALGDLKRYLSIAYTLSGTPEPRAAMEALSTLKRYVQDLAMRYSGISLDGYPFNCSQLPSQELIEQLNETLHRLHDELEAAAAEPGSFHGLSREVVEGLASASSQLERLDP